MSRFDDEEDARYKNPRAEGRGEAGKAYRLEKAKAQIRAEQAANPEPECAKCMISKPDILADLTAEELSHIGYLCDSEAHNARWTEIAERFDALAKERGK